MNRDTLHIADITVLLIHKISERISTGFPLPDVYQHRVGVVYDMVAVTNLLPTALRDSLLLIHAFCGCDTTSGLYGHGYTAITSSQIPSNAIKDVFYDKESSTDQIYAAGETLMMSIYKSKVNLDEQRYLTYCRRLGAGDVKEKKKVINLAMFPPALMPPDSIR